MNETGCVKKKPKKQSDREDDGRLQWTLADVSRGGGGKRAPLMMTVGAKGTVGV